VDNISFESNPADIAWCPGCGNFAILKILKQALGELVLNPKNVVLVSGVGQAAKIPQYLRCNYFNGLHGRALPPATAIKAVNPNLTVIAESGDGDMYGEGGNHFIHTIRRNPNITNIVHNNMVYGLTKGQVNPLSVAISLDASFVARVFCGDPDHTREVLKKAIQHKGYALVDILQPCVSFNKINTHQWFKEHTYKLEDSYDPTNRAEAFKRSLEHKKLPLGIFYQNADKKSFEEQIPSISRDFSENITKLSQLLLDNKA